MSRMGVHRPCLVATTAVWLSTIALAACVTPEHTYELVPLADVSTSRGTSPGIEVVCSATTSSGLDFKVYDSKQRLVSHCDRCAQEKINVLLL